MYTAIYLNNLRATDEFLLSNSEMKVPFHPRNKPPLALISPNIYIFFLISLKKKKKKKEQKGGGKKG